jgi:hypothetical protein
MSAGTDLNWGRHSADGGLNVLVDVKNSEDIV